MKPSTCNDKVAVIKLFPSPGHEPAMHCQPACHLTSDSSRTMSASSSRHTFQSPIFIIETFLRSPYGIGHTIIFLPCGLFFLSSSSSFFFIFSSPNLSRHRLDVCHTCTHGVALVRISEAGLKRAAHGSLKTQDAKVVKNRCLVSGHHCSRTNLSGYIFANKASIDNRKKHVKQQYLLHAHVLIIW